MLINHGSVWRSGKDYSLGERILICWKYLYYKILAICCLQNWIAVKGERFCWSQLWSYSIYEQVLTSQNLDPLVWMSEQAQLRNSKNSTSLGQDYLFVWSMKDREMFRILFENNHSSHQKSHQRDVLFDIWDSQVDRFVWKMMRCWT